MTRMEVDKDKPRDTKTHPQTIKQAIPVAPHISSKELRCTMYNSPSLVIQQKPYRGKTHPPTRKYKGREISVTLPHGLSFKA